MIAPNLGGSIIGAASVRTIAVPSEGVQRRAVHGDDGEDGREGKMKGAHWSCRIGSQRRIGCVVVAMRVSCRARR